MENNSIQTSNITELFSLKHGIEIKDAEELLAVMEEVHYRKGEILMHEGEVCSSFYIIKDGLWRGFYMRDGNDTSLWFAYEGETIFSTSGYISNKPSMVSIEAMTDSTLYKISKNELETFFCSSISRANMGRHIFEKEFLAIEEKLINTGSPQAKERYLKLLEKDPELLKHVPLKHIASYLYVTPQSLSRIRADIAKKYRLAGLKFFKILYTMKKEKE